MWIRKVSCSETVYCKIQFVYTLTVSWRDSQPRPNNVRYPPYNNRRELQLTLPVWPTFCRQPAHLHTRRIAQSGRRNERLPELSVAELFLLNEKCALHRRAESGHGAQKATVVLQHSFDLCARQRILVGVQTLDNNCPATIQRIRKPSSNLQKHVNAWQWKTIDSIRSSSEFYTDIAQTHNRIDENHKDRLKIDLVVFAKNLEMYARSSINAIVYLYFVEVRWI